MINRRRALIGKNDFTDLYWFKRSGEIWIETNIYPDIADQIKIEIDNPYISYRIWSFFIMSGYMTDGYSKGLGWYDDFFAEISGGSYKNHKYTDSGYNNYTTPKRQDEVSNQPYILLASYSKNAGSNPYAFAPPLQILSITILNNGNERAHFIPKMEKKTGVIGLMDTCGNISPITGTNFFTGSGTGTLLGGTKTGD